MKSLTKLWGDFSKVQLDRNNIFVTPRLILEKLNDPNKKDPPLYIAINSLSGSIDIFTEKEGNTLEIIQQKKYFQNIDTRFLNQLKNRGYIFPSKEVENLVFDTIINKYKNLKYSKDKIFPLFAIDTSCPMQCEYCFEKKYLKQPDIFERSVMDKEALISAFNSLEMIKNLQNKEIEFIGGWGGEPLQEKHLDINEEFILQSKLRGWPIGYFSNLALIQNKLLLLIEKNQGHIKFIQTTLDSIGKDHNKYRKIPHAFEKTTETIDELLKMGISVRVRTNIGPHNLSSLPKLAQFYHKKGWFDFPNFRTFVVKTFDRHHDQTKDFFFTEDEALSQWLKMNDQYPEIRKIETFKFVPALYNLLKAFSLRNAIDVIHDDFEISIKPMLTYCYAGNRAMYVFTGKPNYSIYNCAECVGLSKFKIGKYHPQISFDPEKKKIWSIDGNDFYNIRSIDRLAICKDCIAATHCGGHCALEAITKNGSAHNVFCKNAPQIISNFIKKESARLYKRSKIFLDKTSNLSL